jgi:hypothetical protein
MSEALTISPTMRFAELQRGFKAMLGSRRKRLSAIQAFHISKAAALQQVVEISILERAIGRPHDRSFIEELKQDIQRHLLAAGADHHKRKAKRK